MTTKKLEQVIATVLDSHHLPLEVNSSQVEEFINADWAEGEEHEAWLETASVDEIADWVIAGLK